MKLLICPMLTVPKSPLTISCLLSFSGRVVATSWQTSRISSYLFLNQALGMLNCSISCFMARISISFSAFRQFISLRTQVMFPTLDCCSSKTCWIFSLSLSLRARESVSAALLERKLAMKLAIFSKSGLISSVLLVLAVIMFLIDDAHHLVQLLKLVGLHFTGKGEHGVDKSVN